MKTSLALYPFSSHLLPIVNYFEQLQEKYSICELLSLPGFGLIGYDASYACNRAKTNIIVRDDQEIEDPNWNTLLLTDLPEESLIDNIHIFDFMKRTLATGKSVIYCGDNRIDILKKVWGLKEKYCDNLLISTESSIFTGDMVSEKIVCQIKTPIVLIGNLVECNDSLEVALSLASQFIKHSMHPTVITKQSLGKIFGFHTFNHIFTNNCLSEAQKMEEINRFVAILEKEEVPDVILIEAPDAVMRFNEIAPNGFGIRTYMVAQALHVDSIICCAPFGLAYGALLEALSHDFAMRFGSPIHAAQVSNIVIDMAELTETYKVTYSYANLNSVHEHIANEATNSSIPFYDVVSEGSEKLFQYLCALLDLH
jgi:peptide maturation system protein (TIGR04066 family)